MKTLRIESAASRALLAAEYESLREATMKLLSHLCRMLVHTLRYGDWRMMELWNFFLAFFWGGFLILSPWSVMDQNPSYRVLNDVAKWVNLTGDGLWGFLLWIGAILVIHGFRTEHLATQQLGALHLVAVWSFVWVCFLMQNPKLTSTVSIPLYLLPNAWVCYRVTQSARFREVYRRRFDDRVADEDKPPSAGG